MDRRELLCSGMATAAGLVARPAFAQGAAPRSRSIDAYSRHPAVAEARREVAEACIEMAFDGLDITVRALDPRVPCRSRRGEDRPATFVDVIRCTGLLVDTITTNISDADSPNAEAILDAASQLGIKHYWWGTYRYDLTKPIQPQIDALKPRVAKLAKLNEKYGMKAMYHNYSGAGTVGNAIFDFLEVLQNFDPRWVSFHYDTGHATEAAPMAPGRWACARPVPISAAFRSRICYYKLNLMCPKVASSPARRNS